MKRTIISLSILMASTSSHAQTASNFYNPASYVTNTVTNQMMNSVTTAMQRAGQAATSAASVITRANIGRYAARAVGLGGGVLGLAASVAVGELISRADFSLTSNPDGTVTYTGITQIPATDGFSRGVSGWKGSNKGTMYSNGDMSDVYTTYSSIFEGIFMSRTGGKWPGNGSAFKLTNCTLTSSYFQCDVRRPDGSSFMGVQTLAGVASMPASCSAGQMYSSSTGTCVSDGSGTKGQPTTTTIPPGQLGTALPPAVLDSPVTREEQAKLLNVIGQGMISSNYPVPTITPADVPTPTTAPKLRDFVEPVPNTASVTPSVNPDIGEGATTTSPTTPTTTNPDGTTVNNIKVDLGPDPGIGAPSMSLETPSASSILSPFLNLLPDLRHPNFTGPGGSCTFGNTFQIYGKTMSFGIVCDMLDPHVPTIRAAMTAFFTILAVIIVLGA